MRSDVFQELKDGGSNSGWICGLAHSLLAQDPQAGLYSSTDVHGTPEYRLHVNIDAQEVQLQGNLYAEKIEPRGLWDPEAGEGIRYRFNKKLRLKAGPHKVRCGHP